MEDEFYFLLRCESYDKMRYNFLQTDFGSFQPFQEPSERNSIHGCTGPFVDNCMKKKQTVIILISYLHMLLVFKNDAVLKWFLS